MCLYKPRMGFSSVVKSNLMQDCCEIILPLTLTAYFGLLFALIILLHKQMPSLQPRGCCQGVPDLSGDSCHLCYPSFRLHRLPSSW